jgi:hypothetical protein
MDLPITESPCLTVLQAKTPAQNGSVPGFCIKENAVK